MEVDRGAELQGTAVQSMGSRHKPLRLTLARSMIGGYEASRGGFDNQSAGSGKNEALGLLGLLAFSRLMDTNEFWVSAGAQATEGDDWDAGIDLVEPGKPRVHYPIGFVNKALGGVSMGVQWYFDDSRLRNSRLLIRRSSPAEPTQDYGFDPATRTTITPYLASPSRLRRP